MPPEPTLLGVVSKALPPSIVNGAAIVASLLPQVEAGLRIVSLLAAITYTFVLIYKALRKND